MTTVHFNETSSAVAQAMNAVKTQYCAPPHYRPLGDIDSTMACTKCGSTLRFHVSGQTGRSHGVCSARNCIRWAE